MNSTTLVTSLHKSITSASLSDTYREPHLLLDNSVVLILSCIKISAYDRQSAELESNSGAILFPQLKTKIAIDTHRPYKNDAERTQHGNLVAQLRTL